MWYRPAHQLLDQPTPVPTELTLLWRELAALFDPIPKATNLPLERPILVRPRSDSLSAAHLSSDIHRE